MNKLQNCILEVFKEIDKICTQNDINYYAIGGTCIGAVRHKGFIPWDDDLDIAMPRKDYEKFLKIAPELLPSNLKIRGLYDSEHQEDMIVKVHDVTTTFIENFAIQFPDRYVGIWVDIMPLDGLPNNILFRKIHFRKIKLLNKLNAHRRMNVEIYHTSPKSIFVWKAIKTILDLFPYDYFTKKYEECLKQYSFDDSVWSCYGWSGRCEQISFKAEGFRKAVVMKFEDYHMRVPERYDEFLTTMFGDYMNLPSEEERIAKHEAFIDLNESYTTYQKNGINRKQY